MALVCLTVVAVFALALAGYLAHLSFREDDKPERDTTVKDAVSSFGFMPRDQGYWDGDDEE